MGKENNNIKNIKLTIDRRDTYQDIFDQIGLDINQLSKNEREIFISILKKEIF